MEGLGLVALTSQSQREAYPVVSNPRGPRSVPSADRTMAASGLGSLGEQPGRAQS